MQERRKPETLSLETATPALTVNDIEASLAFYRDVLGFVVVDEMRPEGRLVGASVRAGEIDFMLAQDDFAKGKDRVKGVGFRMYCTTSQDVDRVAADIKARGGTLVAEPADQPWGARDFSLEDPDGYKISISSGLGDS